MPRLDIDHLSDDAKLWVFGISPQIDASQQQVLLGHVDAFLDGWTAHGAPIDSAREIREGRFLLIAADESSETSGCSIDRLYGTLRALESQLGVTILDPTRVFLREEGTIRHLDRAAFAAAATPETIVFDTTAERLRDVRSGAWERVAAASWHRQLLAN